MQGSSAQCVPHWRPLGGYNGREQRHRRSGAVAELAGRCDNYIYSTAATITMGGGYPPLILKWGGLMSSIQGLIPFIKILRVTHLNIFLYLIWLFTKKSTYMKTLKILFIFFFGGGGFFGSLETFWIIHRLFKYFFFFLIHTKNIYVLFHKYAGYY